MRFVAWEGEAKAVLCTVSTGVEREKGNVSKLTSVHARVGTN